MKKVQRFMGVGDSKPAAATIGSAPSARNIYLNSATTATQLAAPATPAALSSSYDSSVNRLVPPSPSAPNQQSGSRQVSPQSSQTMLHSNRASPQPQSPSAQQQQYFDLPTRAASPGAGVLGALSPRPVSPLPPPASTPGASASPTVHLVERPDLHKSLKAVESLLVNLDEYRDLSARLAKIEKKLAKSAAELERTKVVLETPSQTLSITSTMFEGLAEVSSKHAKHVQREYEAVNDACAKYFKKVAKEERAHDELVANLDAKIKKANAAHEKNVKKASANKALESHDKYIATVQALTNDITRTKNAHAISMAAKSHASSLLVASTVGGLADLEFKRRCESVRKVGSHVGRLNELLCFASSEYMPALQAAEFDEAEQGQAQYLASLAAQVEAQVAAQAQINAKINEDTQTILRAQEMGWRPPSPLPTPHSNYANMGQSNSTISDSNIPKPNLADGADKNLQSSESATSNHDMAVGVRGNYASSVAATSRSLRPDEASNAGAEMRGIPAVADSDVASTHSVATDQTPRQAAVISTSSSVLLGAPNASARLDRTPTGLTTRSMIVQPQRWEDASISSASSAVGQPVRAPSVHDRSRTDSSTRNGSIFDKLAIPNEDLSSLTPSLSTTNSAQGSEDDVRAPQTPLDTESPSLGSVDRNVVSKQQGQQQDEAGSMEYRSNLTASSNMRPAQRALEQYREQTAKLAASPIGSHFEHGDLEPRSSSNVADGAQNLGRSDSIYSATSQQSDVGQEQANARKVSLWERERERMRQLEREQELTVSRSAMSGNQTMSRPAWGMYGSSNAGSYTNSGWARSKMSDGSAGDGHAGSQLGLGYPRTSSQDSNGDLDRYAPAVGSTRLSGADLQRSLSTDTTASERSFVARMKARYQAEKDLEREQRELNVLEKERAARRTAMDPNLSLALGRNRVPEIASRYQMPGAGTYPQEVIPPRRLHDSLPTNVMSRGSAISSAPSASAGVDEFGSVARGLRNPTAEPPHSDVCGRHQCSARHYASAGTGGRKNPSEFNQRRISMPVPPRKDSQQPQYKRSQQQAAYASSPPRGNDEYRYRQQQHLGTSPVGRDVGSPRRSYDEFGAGAESRRVVFAQEPQTIR